MSYEANILNAKILRAARLTDPATYVSISVLAKDAREYLKNKKIEVSETESLMLIIAALAHNRDAAMPAIIRRHIVSWKVFYEELNKQKEIKKIKETAAPEIEPAEIEPAELEPATIEPATIEPAELEPIMPEELEKNVIIRGDSAKNLGNPGC